MSVLPVEALLAPLAEGRPCGVDLEYDPDFVALVAAAEGTPERQAGNVILPAKQPLWPEVHEAALKLALLTRDLRVAVLLARSGARLGGIAGYASGLALVSGLLDRFWDDVHPKLDDALGGATMRLNSLTPLSDLETGLADVRAIAIGKPGAGLTVRLIELAWTKTEPWPSETRPTQAGLLEALRQTVAKEPQIVPALKAVQQTLTSIEQTLAQRTKSTEPDFQPLRRIADALAQAAAQLEGAAAPQQDIPDSAGHSAAPGAVVPPGGIQSRNDVIRTLDQVCAWIEQHEPSNPAPLLIRRAQRLMSKSFLDLVNDLAPDGVKQLELIAGIGNP